MDGILNNQHSGKNPIHLPSGNQRWLEDPSFQLSPNNFGYFTSILCQGDVKHGVPCFSQFSQLFWLQIFKYDILKRLGVLARF